MRVGSRGWHTFTTRAKLAPLEPANTFASVVLPRTSRSEDDRRTRLKSLDGAAGQSADEVGEGVAAHVAQHEVVHLDDARRRHGPHEVDGLVELGPRAARGEQQKLDRRIGHDVRITGVVDRAVDDVADVVHLGNIGVDRRVVLTDHGHLEARNLEGITARHRGHAVVVHLERVHYRRGCPDPEVGLRVERSVQDARVEVVRVVVRHENGGGAGDELCGVGRVGAGVDDKGFCSLREDDGGVGVLGEFHVENYTANLYRCAGGLHIR